jgi:hypothetical protein
MPYVDSYYYSFGGTQCVQIKAWRCCGGGDANDTTRNSITSAYFSLFGRYGELAGVEGYVSTWVYNNGPALYGTITEMVRRGGDRNASPPGSGEWNDVQSRGRHVWGGAGSCPVLGCTDPAATNYNRNATQDNGSCTYPAPTVSISVNPSSIIRGNSSTLSWSASGVVSSVTVTDVSSPSNSGSRSVSPPDDKTYFITASGSGGSSTASTTLVVYIPPVITLSLNKTSIIAGQCTTLSWSTTGDASSIQWNSQNVNNFNLTSNTTVCPTDTTTYTATVSGLGGTDNDTITLTVNQIPTLSLTTPESLDYGNTGSFSYESQYVDISLNLKIYYRYASETVLVTDLDLPTASSTQLSALDSATKRSGTIDLNMEYNDFGPRYVDVVLTANASGGNATVSKEIVINIDERPENIIVPEKDDAIKAENPVFAPETEILSELLLISDIDIPVEIKSNSPIQVDINGQNNWQNLRQIID